MQLTMLAPVQLWNSLPTWAALWVNDSVSLAGLIKKYGGRRGVWPAVANAPVSLVYPDALRLTGMVVNSGIDMHR